MGTILKAFFLALVVLLAAAVMAWSIIALCLLLIGVNP